MTKPKTSKAISRAKANASLQPPAPALAAPKGWTLESPSLAPGETPDKLMAQVASNGIVGNARSLVAFGHGTFGELSLTDCVKVLKDTAQSLNDGDLSAAVTMLSSQAVALNAMFGELARRSALNMGEYIEASERYMRLALKAQGQCRATLETLAAIKNPPVVFARQANINNGGQQQVNNGPAQNGGAQMTGPSRAQESGIKPNELLEGTEHAVARCPIAVPVAKHVAHLHAGPGRE
jgi:hypothetical protein